MLPALVMRGRAPAAGAGAFQSDAVDESIEAQIEIKPSLLPIGDDIQACGHLIMNGDNRSVLLKFGDVSGAKLIETSGREFQPCGKRITADNSGAQGDRLH